MRAYLEEKIAPSSVHFARLQSQLLVAVDGSSLSMVCSSAPAVAKTSDYREKT